MSNQYIGSPQREIDIPEYLKSVMELHKRNIFTMDSIAHLRGYEHELLCITDELKKLTGKMEQAFRLVTTKEDLIHANAVASNEP